MDDADRFYLGAGGGIRCCARAGPTYVVADYVSCASHDRIASHLAKHPAAGFTAREVGLTVPDKIAGLLINGVDGQAEDVVVMISLSWRLRLNR